MKTLFRAFGIYRTEGRQILLSIFLLLASSVFSVVKPWPLTVLVDRISGSATGGKPGAGGVLMLVSLVLVFHVLHAIFSAWQNYLTIGISLRGLSKVRRALFEKLAGLPRPFFQSNSPGDLIYRGSWDTYAFQTLFQQGAVAIAGAVIAVTLMVGVMLQLNLTLTCVAMAIAPFLVWAIKYFGKKMSEQGNLAQKNDSRVTSLVEQLIGAIVLVQSYNRQESQKQTFAAAADEARKTRNLQHRWEIIYSLVILLLFGLAHTAVIYVGIGQISANHLTLGQLLLFLAYLSQLYEPLNQLSRVGSTLATAKSSIERVYEILDAPEEDVGGGELLKSDLKGTLHFKGVWFGYQPDRPVLQDLTFSIPFGDAVAIVGHSGAGKSTILNLLLGFYKPWKGTITIDETDISLLKKSDLRERISYVMQEPLLLPGTLAYNIALGKPDSSIEKIREAALRANALDFITRLPEGFETIVAETGQSVSVGEKQRINLARALLKPSSFLLLDEPTSSLDAESEEMIANSLASHARARTLIMVAHRVASIRHVDKIIVIERGRLLAIGSREEILKRYPQFLGGVNGVNTSITSP
ncbi:MAG: transporter related-protein [Verrucomicrobiales bacterium]|nr:transporter related-protein [Verrucomicrobiales bacterium]